MATAGTYLDMKFSTDVDGIDKSIRLNYADPEMNGDDVNTLMGVIVTNGAMFTEQPTAKKAAQVVTTSVRDIILV